MSCHQCRWDCDILCLVRMRTESTKGVIAYYISAMIVLILRVKRDNPWKRSIKIRSAPWKSVSKGWWFYFKNFIFKKNNQKPFFPNFNHTIAKCVPPHANRVPPHALTVFLLTRTFLIFCPNDPIFFNLVVSSYFCRPAPFPIDFTETASSNKSTYVSHIKLLIDEYPDHIICLTDGSKSKNQNRSTYAFSIDNKIGNIASVSTAELMAISSCLS